MSRQHDMSQLPVESRGIATLGAGSSRNYPAEAFNSLLEFYSQDGPWVPRHSIPVQHNRHNEGAVGSHGSMMPMGSWGLAPSSVYRTHPMPSDSGYESHPQMNLENSSVFDEADQSQDAHSVAGTMNDYAQFPQLTTPSYVCQDAQISQDFSRANWQSPGLFPPSDGKQENDPGSRLICPDCRQSVRTKSELNKHDQRHRKPYRCEVPDCTRTQGFSTRNDLDRHKKSCHPLQTPGTVFYRCQHGPCAAKQKQWPRADNFRSHLQRMHSISIPSHESLSAYAQVASLEPTSNPGTVQIGLEGIGSACMDYNVPSGLSSTSTRTDKQPHSTPAQFQVPIQEESLEIDMADSLAEARTEIEPAGCTPGTGILPFPLELNSSSAPCFDQPHERSPDRSLREAVESEIGASQDVKTRADRAECFAASTEPTEVYEKQESTPRFAMTAPASSGNTPTEAIDLEMVTEEPENIQSQACHGQGKDAAPAVDLCVPDSQAESAMMRLLKTIPRDLIERYLKEEHVPERDDLADSSAKSTDPTAPPSEKLRLQCSYPNCYKSFPRRCELRKHEKRHSKPFGCTFPGCAKLFGSKNDWKRHENSQHFQLETWKCLEFPGVAHFEACGKVFPRREQFKAHLQSAHRLDHGAEGDAKVDQHLRSCRIGRNCESTFWCGFCANIIEIANKDVHAWRERFDHIEDHFNGRKNLPRKTMADWQAVDPDTTSVSSAYTSPARGHDAAAATDEETSDFELDEKEEQEQEQDKIEDSLGEGHKAGGGAVPRNGKRKFSKDHGPRHKRSAKNEAKEWTCCSCAEINFDGDATCLSTDSCLHRRCQDCGVRQGPVIQPGRRRAGRPVKSSTGLMHVKDK